MNGSRANVLQNNVHLADADDDLAGPLEHPILARLVLVGLVRGDHHVAHREQHHVLHLKQPLLDGAARLGGRDALAEADLLALRREHGQDVELRVELEFRDALEALLEVRLDAHRVLRLGQDLEHLVVREEEEAREEEPLLLEIRVEALVDAVEQRVALAQLLEQSRVRRGHQHRRVAHRIAHHVLRIAPRVIITLIT